MEKSARKTYFYNPRLFLMLRQLSVVRLFTLPYRVYHPLFPLSSTFCPFLHLIPFQRGVVASCMARGGSGSSLRSAARESTDNISFFCCNRASTEGEPETGPRALRNKNTERSLYQLRNLKDRQEHRRHNPAYYNA